MELKNVHPSRPKISFRENKVKVLHCNQHDFIRQRPGISKEQTCSKEQTFSKVLLLITFKNTF